MCVRDAKTVHYVTESGFVRLVFFAGSVDRLPYSKVAHLALYQLSLADALATSLRVVECHLSSSKLESAY